MSKFLKVLMVVALAAAMVAPAVAEDRLSLAGAMEVRGFFTNVDNGTTDTSDAWNDQRFRVGGKIAVAEGVSVNFRFDATESPENSSGRAAWGSDDTNKQYTQRRADVQFDKAYLQLDNLGGYTLQAGELYYGGAGIGTLGDVLGAGVVVKRGTASVFFIKQGEDHSSATQNDAHLIGAQYGFKTDTMSITPMVAYNDESAKDANLLGLGLNAAAKLGAINIKGDLNVFSGEKTAAVDYTGTQLYLDASTALSDTVTVGGIFLYATGETTDDQVTRMKGTGFGGFSPQTYGYHTTDYSIDVDVFDPAAKNAGVIGFSGYADVKMSADLAAKFAAYYWQVEEDTVVDADGFILNASAKYALAKNTSLTGGVNYSSTSVTGFSDVDVIQAITGLYVKF